MNMYVSLEPCCHTGKTGPCTKSIIDSGIKNVFVSTLDPNPKVKGKGVKEFKDASNNSESDNSESEDSSDRIPKK